MHYIRHRFRLALFTAISLILVRVGTSQTPNKALDRPSPISLKQALAPATPWRTVQRPIQFFSDTSILILSGPSGDCYHSVAQIALNLISIDGHLIARKPWPSTDPGVVIDAERLVLAGSSTLEVDGPGLASMQSVGLPPHRFYPSIQRLDQQDAVTVSMDGKAYRFGGTPLELLNQPDLQQRGASKGAFTFEDGQVIVLDGESLRVESAGHPIRKIASLQWVTPSCGRYIYCQAYDAGTGLQVSTGRKRRILVYSNGSRFPVTDAAGLFPYFRLQVFDFDSGAELYREENKTRTGDRSAAISPDGDRLATTNGQTIVFRNLP